MKKPKYIYRIIEQSYGGFYINCPTMKRAKKSLREIRKANPKYDCVIERCRRIEILMPDGEWVR